MKLKIDKNEDDTLSEILKGCVYKLTKRVDSIEIDIVEGTVADKDKLINDIKNIMVNHKVKEVKDVRT